MPRKIDSRTYRVRDLPAHVERYQVPALLLRLEPGIGFTENVVVASLATTRNAWVSCQTKMATIMFKMTPAAFEGPEEQWTLRGREDGLLNDVILDVHFHGFTILNEVDTQTYAFDCIAITGLAGHAFGSWKETSHQSDFMWLRDQLPIDLPMARSITFGYDSQILNSQSIQTIDDIALRFVHQLQSFGQSALSAKPVIFLAHSLGGLVLQRAVVLLANSGDAFRFMLDCFMGIILFGVPNRGMITSHLLPMVKGQPQKSLIESLALGSSYLQEHCEQFRGLVSLRDIDVVSAFETKLSQVPKQLADDTLIREGPFQLLVDRPSATYYSREPQHMVPIDKDHSQMVKFGRIDDQYQAIRHCLTDMASRASENRKRGAKHIDGNKFVANDSDDADMQREAFMGALFLPIQDLRKTEIEEALYGTFDWIYERDDLGFASWAQNNGGPFWVSGKPGSGKSTFMKYICQDPRTRDLMHMSERHGARNVQAEFFFHDRGTHEQKSLEGLLRTVLHKILSSDNDVLDSVIDCLKTSFPAQSNNSSQDWTFSMQNLQLAFSHIFDQSRVALNIWLFIDALDEFDGSPDVIVSLINALTRTKPSSKTRFHICFSSRPWNEFNDAFSRQPGLRLQEHTVHDMMRFTNSKIEDSQALRECLKAEDGSILPAGSRLIDSIVEKSQGVFLWVTLIMRELHQACTDGSSTYEMSEILATFPQSLEGFYVRILERLPAKYRPECFYMVEIVLRSTKTVKAEDLHFGLSVATQEVYADCLAAVRAHQDLDIPPSSKEYMKRIARRLMSRSGGLLELKGTTIQFMHQTVKDFVDNPSFRRFLFKSPTPTMFANGHVIWLKLSLTLLCLEGKAASDERIQYPSRYVDAKRMQSWLSDSVYHAFMSESTIGKSQKRYLDSVSDELFERAVSLAMTNRKGEICVLDSIAAFAGAAGLELYAGQKLVEGNFSTSSAGTALLISAVRASTHASDGCPNPAWRSCPEPQRLVRLAIDNGVSVKSHYQGMSPLQWLFFRERGWDRSSRMSQAEIDTLQILLRTGELSVVEALYRPFDGHPKSTTLRTRQMRDTSHSTGETALHIAPPSFTADLLHYGASVNAVDNDGWTPLDRLLSEIADSAQWISEAFRKPGYAHIKYWGQGKLFEHLHESCLLLIEHGGRITSVGKKSLPKALLRLRRYCEPDKRLVNLAKSQLFLPGRSHSGTLANLLQKLRPSSRK